MSYEVTNVRIEVFSGLLWNHTYFSVCL